MSQSSAGQCSYTYDPPGNVTPDESVDVHRPAHEQCPYAAVDSDAQRCLFHHGESDYPSDRFTEQFLQHLSDSESRPVFAGGHLPGLELQNQTVATATQDPIDLRGAVIDGDLDLTNTTVEVPLLLDGAAITGSLNAENAEFLAPVSLAGADVRGGMYAHGATIAGGLVGNDLNAGYLDARTLGVEGPVIFDQASFGSNLIIARATVDGDLSLEDAAFDWSFDGTAATIGGDFAATDATVDADCDVVAAHIDGDVEFRKVEVNGDTDWSHAEVGGDLRAPDCVFDGEAIFDDVAVGGEALVFDGTEFAATADFATMSLTDSRISFANVRFGDEVWFTHATIGEFASFDGATFEGMSHLRDAVFEDDLSLRNIRATGQFFLHGSTIEGDCDCTDAHVDHFQFSATVHGKSDFSHARFDEKAIFKSSTFGDRVWFDEGSFAGFVDFSDTRFTGKTTFDNTEFLVDPDFEDTRFAVDPDLSAADFSLADAIDFEDRRGQMILAHPDSLQHDGTTLPLDRVTGEVSIPANATHLVEDSLSNTRAVVHALSDFDQRSWYKLCDQSLRTARTAVAQLPNPDTTILVFGLRVNKNEQGAELIDDAIVAGVYCRTDDAIVFGHLDPTFLDVDYLLPIPAGDDAFESGAAVATPTELHKAAVRNEGFRAVMLGKEPTDGTPVHQMILPVLVGAIEIT